MINKDKRRMGRPGLLCMAALTALGVLAMGAWLFSLKKQPVSIRLPPKEPIQNEAACYEWLQSHMIADGGVRTNYHAVDYDEQLATGAEVLSESQGLLMNYAALRGDEPMFDAAYGFVKRHLDNGELFVYRYNPTAPDEQAYAVNALVDDLRILKGLLAGRKAFQRPWLAFMARRYAARLYRTNVQGTDLFDFYDSKHAQRNRAITLCYLDIETLDALIGLDRQWEGVRERALERLEGGYISDAFPLFMTSYDYDTLQYSAPNGINMIEALLSANHLAAAGRCAPQTIEFIKQRVSQAKLYGRYTLQGKPQTNLQSTAVYALCAMLGQKVGDEDLVSQSIARMNQFQVRDKHSALYGAFGDEKNVYSFDNLMALTAYREGIR